MRFPRRCCAVEEVAGAGTYGYKGEALEMEQDGWIFLLVCLTKRGDADLEVV
jgi:hypothetical protein